MGKLRPEVWPRKRLLGGSMRDGKLSHSGAKVAQKRHKCPKCGKYYVGYPALSHENNKTEICPECGVREAIQEFYLRRRRD